MLLPGSAVHSAVANPNSDEEKGTFDYRSGRFSQAAQAFQQSIGRMPSSDAQRLAIQEDAYYNLGNALYRTGQMTEKSDRQATLEKWTAAVKAYDTALQLRADDADSKFNRDLVKRKIDALRQPPPPPNQGSGQGKAPPKGSPPPGSKPPGSPPSPQGKPPSTDPPPPNASPPSGGTPPPPSAAPNGSPPPAPPTGEPQPQHQKPSAGAPSEMSQEEARELLDSEKGDERHSLAVPLLRPDADQPPEKPFKNW
jgi:tetratricopeptide (TPR) repeat protein